MSIFFNVFIFEFSWKLNNWNSENFYLVLFLLRSFASDLWSFVDGLCSFVVVCDLLLVVCRCFLVGLWWFGSGLWSMPVLVTMYFVSLSNVKNFLYPSLMPIFGKSYSLLNKGERKRWPLSVMIGPKDQRFGKFERQKIRKVNFRRYLRDKFYIKVGISFPLFQESLTIKSITPPLFENFHKEGDWQNVGKSKFFCLHGFNKTFC